LALAHVGEYVRAICALAPCTHAAPLAKTIATLHHFHPLVEVDFPLFVDDFIQKTDLVLDREAFIYVLTYSPLLSSYSLSNVVYELLQYCFVLDDFASGFEFFLRYVGTSLVVMFLHQYNVYLLQCDYWF
jgi:hypothetical protein